jgi:uncharacterized membrane protein YozB (DUF420 family)
LDLERITDLITIWIPLVIISAGIPLILGSLLNMDKDKMIIASILAAVVAIIGFLIRHYFKEEKEEKPQRTDNKVNTFD